MKIGNNRSSMNMISFIFIIFCVFLTAINSENDILRGITVGEILFHIFLSILIFILKNEKLDKRVGNTARFIAKRAVFIVFPGISFFGWIFGILDSFYIGLFLGPAILVLVVAITIAFSAWGNWGEL